MGAGSLESIVETDDIEERRTDRCMEARDSRVFGLDAIIQSQNGLDSIRGLVFRLTWR